MRSSIASLPITKVLALFILYVLRTSVCLYILLDQVLAALHADRLEEGSKLSYGSAAQHWHCFVATRSTLVGDTFMDSCTEEDKSTFACLFAEYCFQQSIHMDSSFSALRHLFIVNQKSIDFMTNNPHVTSARMSVRKRILNIQKGHSRQLESGFRLGVPKQAPSTYEMMADIRSACFRIDLQPTLKERQIYLGVATQYCFGLRASNICWKGRGNAKGKHALLSQDVMLETGNGIFVPRQDVRSAGYHFSDYMAVHLLPLTCKTGKWGNEILSIYDRSPEEEQLRNDLICWCLDSVAGPSDMFFSYSYVDVKKKLVNTKLTERDITVAMKGTAVRLGLEPTWFSTHCNRIGAATDMCAVVGREEALKILGWKSDAGLVYMRNGSRENSMSLIREGKNSSNLDIRRMMAFNHSVPEAGSYPAQSDRVS